MFKIFSFLGLNLTFFFCAKISKMIKRQFSTRALTFCCFVYLFSPAQFTEIRPFFFFFFLLFDLLHPLRPPPIVLAVLLLLLLYGYFSYFFLSLNIISTHPHPNRIYILLYILIKWRKGLK